MGIARKVIQEFELATDRQVRAGAESGFESGRGGDFAAQEVIAERLGIERRIRQFMRRFKTGDP